MNQATDAPAAKAAATANQTSLKRSAMIGVGMLTLAGGLFYQTLSFPQAELVSTEAALDGAADLRKQRLELFWADKATPLLEQTRAKDAVAMEHAKASLDAMFTKYQAGAPKFADSLTGWGTRFKIIYRSGVESAQGKEEKTWTQQLVQEKFATHVVSQDQLEKDLLAIGKQFAFELEANRNELLASVETQLTAADLKADISLPEGRDFNQQFQHKLDDLLAKLPSSSVKIGVGSLAAGIAAEEAVRQVIRVVLAQLATRLAATAVAAGGSAGAAAATGAGGGTAIAPGVGTAIGLVGGFIVGAFVDWKMTDTFEAKVVSQVNEFLGQMKTTLAQDPTGLLPTLTSQSQESEKLYQQALRDVLVLP